jgi:uncharacterized protein YbcI
VVAVIQLLSEGSQGTIAPCSGILNKAGIRKIIEPPKTQGEMEALICQCISRFELEFMGRGPKDIHAHLIDDLLVVRLQGVLTAAEQHLVQTLPVDKGRDLLKQVRSQLIEIARPKLEEIIRDITGVKPVSLHHDISTVTGEEIVIFTLAAPPICRELKKKV